MRNMKTKRRPVFVLPPDLQAVCDHAREQLDQMPQWWKDIPPEPPRELLLDPDGLCNIGGKC